METIEEIKLEINEMRPIFEKLFNLQSNDIKEILQKIIGCKLNLQNMNVKKISIDDKANKIEIYDWDVLEVGLMGIYLKLEHRNSEKICSLREVAWYLND